MITDIRLQQFRSYADDSFELGAGVNIIVGPNASGKTNLLEAILVLATGSSYRTKDPALVQFEAPWARLDAHTKHGQRTVKIVAENGRTDKTYELDDISYKRLSFDKTIPVVLFEPNDLLLLHGEPGGRREYLDDLAERLVPGFREQRAKYKRALQQRNTLLKRGSGYAASQMFAWNVRLSELGGNVVAVRQETLQQINDQITRIYRELSKKDQTVSIRYASVCNTDNYSSNLLKLLEKNTELDFRRGFTGNGPHRDDLIFELNDQPANIAASRGEVRTLVLALKIIELGLLEKSRGTRPLLLLDDVFSELDGARRRLLTRYLHSYQTFITTTDADVVIKHFASDCNVIPLIGKR